jgi:lipopolysaccharide transport system ATP-binding protein
VSKSIIKVENLGKSYLIAHEGRVRYTALRDVITQKAKSIFSKNSGKVSKEEFWALKNVNFEIKEGESVGIIGRNGAGKSTLLKMLSRITEPTKGRIEINGRVASLLEVGTGFHPELTGRENIFLNGAILGMNQAEIKKKFDEIVDFSGVEKFLDTPVKRYSSGMYVRLAFAVAAHLEPEILVVDEVLAVGDAEFQKKCLGKMDEVSKNEGRTVLFVSHNMGAVTSLCHRAIVMNNGSISFDGTVNKAINHYLHIGQQTQFSRYLNEAPQLTDILEVAIKNSEGELRTAFDFNEDITLEFKVRVQEKYRNAILGFRIKDQLERNVFTSEIELKDYLSEGGEYVFQTRIPSRTLVPNKYTPVLFLHVLNSELLSYLDGQINFDIEETGTDFFQYSGNDYGCVFIDCQWEIAIEKNDSAY